jgi:hypothetical protein
VVNSTPQPLYPLEREPVLIVQEAGWASGPVRTGVENLAPTGIQSPGRPAHGESLYLLHYLICVYMLSNCRRVFETPCRERCLSLKLCYCIAMKQCEMDINDYTNLGYQNSETLIKILNHLHNDSLFDLQGRM